jgi:hypothetical protein
VARAVRPMLTPGGVWVHVHAKTLEGLPGVDRLPHPRPPREDIAALVRRYLGPVRRAGRGFLPADTPSGEDAVMRAAGFDGPTRITIQAGTVRRTEDEVVASVFSLSSSTPHLFGARRDAFERDLRTLLRQTSPDGLFAERMREIALDIWRPRDVGRVDRPHPSVRF